MGKTRYWLHDESDSIMITYGEGLDYQAYRDAPDVDEITKEMYESFKERGYSYE